MPTKPETSEKPKKKVARRNYLYAVGRRKTSIARVRLFKNGEGKITINEKDYKEYFPGGGIDKIIIEPLETVGKLKDYNFTIKVIGGGVMGQAESIRHGISRVLLKVDNSWRQTLKPLGFLKRDPRMKERKKPGLKRARRAPQFSKR